MELFIPPPVLIIQLKRFRLYGTQWRKMQTLVDFPIRNLDLTPFMSDAAFIKRVMGVEPTYNLQGIVCHYGTLGFGHYVAFLRNIFDKKWYRYDDTHKDEVSEDQIHKESAYLLFYVRKDIEAKSVDQIMPKLTADFFAGKPIKIGDQDGFVLENAAPGSSKLEVKLKSQPQKQTVR